MTITADVRAADSKNGWWAIALHTPAFWEALTPGALRHLLSVQRGRAVAGERIPLVLAVRHVFANHYLSCAQSERAFALGRPLFLRLAGEGRRLPVACALEAALARPGGLDRVAKARARRIQRAHTRTLQRMRLIRRLQRQWLHD